MIPPEKIDLYLKVRALAERGVPGERDNARRLLASLEAKYPGIREAAVTASRPPPGAGTPPGGFTGKPPAGGGPGFGAREAFEWTRDFIRGMAEQERQEGERRSLVDAHAVVTSRYTDDGDLVVRLRVTEAGRRAFRKGASTGDLWAIAQQVGKDVADEFVAAMEEEAEAEAAPRRARRR